MLLSDRGHHVSLTANALCAYLRGGGETSTAPGRPLSGLGWLAANPIGLEDCLHQMVRHDVAEVKTLARAIWRRKDGETCGCGSMTLDLPAASHL